ncbi:MAG: SDR family oxidoreductase [Chloroflexi bacterium]|nr:SDR family oxidoreductase [Chloroflexota bacterium]
MSNEPARRWALILGASSGFGGATAVELAKAGHHIVGVHLDRSSTMPMAEKVQADVRAHGKEAIFFNMNAADPEKRKATAQEMRARLRPGEFVNVLMHSLAFGTLRPFTGAKADELVNQKQMEMTLDVMANSLVYWSQDLDQQGLLQRGSKIFAMTSAGDFHAWPSYGPVSAAKAALEAHIRQLAYELASRGISANAIRAGVTDTPALRKIPGNDLLIDGAKRKNPSKRLTTPEDVAKAIAALSDDRAYWITGNVIGVDGGEELTG